MADNELRFRCAFHDVELPMDGYYDHCNEFHGGNLITVMFMQPEDQDDDG